nr:hypothetical protein [Tanacetum cinerariifolium]
MFQDFRYSDTVRPSLIDEVLKLKNFKKDALLKLFKLTNQEMYEHVGPKVISAQDGKDYKIEKRDYAWLMISRSSRITFMEAQAHIRRIFLDGYGVLDVRTIHDNLLDMVNKNKLCSCNKRLKGRDWNEKDVMRSNKIVEKNIQKLNHNEQLRRLKEYPPSAVINFCRRKRGRLRESPLETRLLSETVGTISTVLRWPPRVTLGRLLPHARGLGFKPRREGFPSGAKKEWGLSPKAKPETAILVAEICFCSLESEVCRKYLK